MLGAIQAEDLLEALGKISGRRFGTRPRRIEHRASRLGPSPSAPDVNAFERGHHTNPGSPRGLDAFEGAPTDAASTSGVVRCCGCRSGASFLEAVLLIGNGRRLSPRRGFDTVLWRRAAAFSIPQLGMPDLALPGSFPPQLLDLLE